jgi:hypothetical protein
MRHLWTENEIEILKREYHRRSIEELMKMLPLHTRGSIIHKASRLGLKSPHRWTEEEILFKMYPTAPARYILSKINRSWNAIVHRARKLKIRRIERVTNDALERFINLEDAPLNDVEAGYLAGIIDGEGSITFRKWGSRLYPSIRITNTSKELITKCRRLLGFGLVYTRKDKNHPKYKTQYYIEICDGADVYALLHRILPYLTVKRKQALKALRLIISRRESYLKGADERDRALRDYDALLREVKV